MPKPLDLEVIEREIPLFARGKLVYTVQDLVAEVRRLREENESLCRNAKYMRLNEVSWRACMAKFLFIMSNADLDVWNQLRAFEQEVIDAMDKKQEHPDV